MSFAIHMPRVRNFASDDLAREFVGRAVRFALVLLVLVVSSVVSGPYVKWRRRVHQAPPPDGHSQVM